MPLSILQLPATSATMNFLKTLDQALDFDKIEKAVTENVQRAALSVVEEFPERNKAIPTPASVAITPSGMFCSVLSMTRRMYLPCPLPQADATDAASLQFSRKPVSCTRYGKHLTSR